MNRPDDVPAPGQSQGQSRTIVDPSRDNGDPVFAEPWEAQAFGLVTALHGRGLFSWGEWSAALAIALDGQDLEAEGGDCYHRWLAALERLLAERGLVTTHELDDTTAAWERAARATPHGMPILLENDPGSPG